MPLTATVKMSVVARKTLSGDLGGGTVKAALELVQALIDGAGAGAVDQVFADSRQIAASGNENLDVASGGGLTDVSGAAVAMARVKAIAIKASADNTNDVVLSRPASNGVPIFGAAGDAASIKPGGCFLLLAPNATGYAVTASTADLINVANSSSGSAVDYDIVILGAAT